MYQFEDPWDEALFANTHVKDRVTARLIELFVAYCRCPCVDAISPRLCVSVICSGLIGVATYLHDHGLMTGTAGIVDRVVAFLRDAVLHMSSASDARKDTLADIAGWMRSTFRDLTPDQEAVIQTARSEGVQATFLRRTFAVAATSNRAQPTEPEPATKRSRS